MVDDKAPLRSVSHNVSAVRERLSSAPRHPINDSATKRPCLRYDQDLVSTDTLWNTSGSLGGTYGAANGCQGTSEMSARFCHPSTTWTGTYIQRGSAYFNCEISDTYIPRVECIDSHSNTLSATKYDRSTVVPELPTINATSPPELAIPEDSHSSVCFGMVRFVIPGRLCAKDAGRSLP